MAKYETIIQGNHARNVEAAEIQIDIPACNRVRVHAHHSIRICGLLGLRRQAS